MISHRRDLAPQSALLIFVTGISNLRSTWAAARTRKTYLSALYHRLAARRGAKRAIIAVAHAILVAVYHMLRRGTTYQEFDGNYFEEQDRDRIARRSVQRLERLGYKVTVEVA